MKGRRALFLAAISVLLSIVGSAGSAAADRHAATASASGCGGTVAAAGVMRKSDGSVVGSIQLCGDATSYWSLVSFYQPLPTGTWANAYLIRYVNGERRDFVDCGDDYARPEQPWCTTPRLLRSGANVTFQAAGVLCAGTHPFCERIAYGETPRVMRG